MNASKQSVAKAAAQHRPRATPTPVSPSTGAASRLGNGNLHSLLRARVLQAKLTVSHPHDPYEIEADSVAERVMRMPDPATQTVARAPLQIQRACRECEQELRRSSEPAGNVPVVSDATEQSIGQLSSRGNPLPQSVRAFMEPRFNADFSAVRVHTDANANTLARSVNAKAFTVGNNLVFAAGRYAPHTDTGKRLLAHELTHVVQQGAAGRIARQPEGGVESSPLPKMSHQQARDLLLSYVTKGGASDSSGALDAISETLSLPFTIPDSPQRARKLAAAFMLLAPEDAESVFEVLSGTGGKQQRAARAHFIKFAAPIRDALLAILDERRSTAGMPKATWVEIHDGVFAFVPPFATTLNKIAAYLSGHHQVPEELAKLNQLPVDAAISAQQPVIVPIEFIDRKLVFQQMPRDIAKKVFERRLAAEQNETHRRFVEARNRGPYPGAFGLAPLTTEIITQAGKMAHLVLRLVGFIGGIIHGFLKSIWDAVSGIAKMLYGILKSIVTGELISDVKTLAKALMNLKWEDIRNSLGSWAQEWADKLNSKNPLTSGWALGYLTGYVMAEAAMLLLSVGTLTAFKGALWISNLGKVVKASRAAKTMEATLGKVSSAANKVGSEFNKGVEALRHSRFSATVKAAEAAGAGIAWTASKVMQVLALPGDIAHYLAAKIVEHAKILEPFFPRISDLSNRAKRWLFGCNSPCKFEPAEVTARLAQSTNEEIEGLAAAAARVKDAKPVLTAERPAATVAQPIKKEPPSARGDKDTQQKAKRTGDVETGGPDTIPARQLRKELKERLERDRQAALDRILDVQHAKARIDAEVRSINERLKARPDAAEAAQLKARREALITERINELGKTDGLAADYLKLDRQLQGTERDYFDSLTSSASQRPEYLAVKARKRDEVFNSTGGPLEVEHVYPRSKIFSTPGFEKLTPDQQLALFNYAPNLKLIPKAINLARSNMEYRVFWRKKAARFPHVTDTMIDAMAELEAKMKAAIEGFIKRPLTIPGVAP